ncbi:helix-turn-helix transcriptional regulator [Aliikangiella marina]|uniref:Helix-turn-helix transcriptional regulator n=1 Tax=Aliikangiella marina TaxID=1712262 RepID=A0A545THG4_9GAMM|nr:helix-turn-helix transcriptional regulator [Aliikangiella marina]TQV76652.1 helix-turn-helix transcriptional regulator [Aliikangiella marina]
MDEMQRKEIAVDIGKRLSEYRKKAGFRSQTDLAEYMNCSRTRIAYWEAGRRTPDIFDIIQLAEILKVSPAILCGFRKQ